MSKNPKKPRLPRTRNQHLAASKAVWDKSTPAQQRQLAKLRDLANSHSKGGWKFAEQVSLMLEDGFKQTKIAIFMMKSKGWVSTLHSVWRDTTPEMREKYEFHELADMRRIMTQWKGEQITYEQLVDEYAGRGMSVRQVKALLSRRQQESRNAENAGMVVGEEIQQRCHLGQWEDLLDTIPSGIKILHADPPYHGAVNDSMNDWATEFPSQCANNTSKDALRTTLNLFKMLLPNIADDGILFLWQNGAREDSPEVVLSAREHGWACIGSGVWDKGVPAPGSFSSPISTSVERFLVYAKNGTAIHRCSDEHGREQVWTHAPVTKGYRKGSPRPHLFSKPMDINKRIIETYSRPGERVVDLYGCFAGFCIAAEKLGRGWNYYEALEENYNEGARRLNELAESDTRTAA